MKKKQSPSSARRTPSPHASSASPRAGSVSTRAGSASARAGSVSPRAGSASPRRGGACPSPRPHANHLPDTKLDLSDIPESTDAQLRRARRVGRPVTGNAKRLIAIRIAPRVLAKLRRLAAKQSKPYQTYIHELLERAVSKKVA